MSLTRPENVPETATFDEATALWRDGSPAEARERLWSHPSGTLLLDAARKDGKFHGEVRWNLVVDAPEQFAGRVALARTLGLPEGSKSTFVARYTDGILDEIGFRVGLTFPDDLRLTFADGQLATAEWRVSPVSGPLFSLGSILLDAKVFKVPKPWPHRVTATFSKGKLKTCELWAKDGTPILPAPGPLKNWGADAEETAIVGYRERGEFAKDLALFFPQAKPVVVTAPAKPVDPILDALLDANKLPYLGTACNFESYRFDPVAEGLYGVEDPKYVGIASDGFGDLYFLNRETGEIALYSVDEGTLSVVFPNLDACLFTLLRLEAVAQKRIPKAAAKALFQRLGLAHGVSRLA